MEIHLGDYKGIWVYIEQNDGEIAGVSLELLGAGRRLADKRGVELAGVLMGSDVTSLVDSLYEYGADKVYLIDDPILMNYRSETYREGFVKIVNQYKPEIILYGATSNGKDLASAAATDLQTGLTADTTMLDVDNETGLLEASRPAFGGNIMATILCKKHRPQMATVRSKVMKAIDPIKGRKGDLVQEKIEIKESEVRTKVLKIVKEVGNKVKLGDAHIIVAGGKGLVDCMGTFCRDVYR